MSEFAQFSNKQTPRPRGNEITPGENSDSAEVVPAQQSDSESEVVPSPAAAAINVKNLESSQVEEEEKADQAPVKKINRNLFSLTLEPQDYTGKNYRCKYCKRTFSKFKDCYVHVSECMRIGTDEVVPAQDSSSSEDETFTRHESVKSLAVADNVDQSARQRQASV